LAGKGRRGYGDRRQTYDELDAATSAFAVHLFSLALEKGDRVALFITISFAYRRRSLARTGFVAAPTVARCVSPFIGCSGHRPPRAKMVERLCLS
jgi:acyl-coenzyme A synthetase/AMP-(fatty) acid ligase